MTEAFYQYQYHYGDRPLEGYTIQRALGRGGFGEVYFAISDSGRQVALKAILNHEQIELRGIKQCMNLKSPHLVTIFDVRFNEQGRPFVIMEYVSGVSLRDLIDQSPGGLGAQKAAFFLREIGKGLAFLHSCGIVHRDLKPSNIFFENGCVKIGDYGLAKSITTAASGQTITVGTVHYMAPEVGQGRYDLSIDIYALGVILYEMLTGQVPFLGASPAEILMRHLMDQPNLAGIEEPFARAIGKALAKDPSQRYRTVQEMVEEVFGPEHIRNSVSQFRPEELSVVAALIAAKAGIDSRQSADAGGQAADTARQPGMAAAGERIGRKIGSAGDKVAQTLASAASGLERHLNSGSAGQMEAGRRQRWLLAIVIMGVISAVVGLVLGRVRTGGLYCFAMLLGLVWGIILARERLLVGLEQRPLRNALAAGVGIAIAALVGSAAHIGGWTILSLFVLALVDWERLTAVDRRQQIEWTPLVWAAAIGGLVALINGNPIVAVGIIAGTILAVQVLSPFGSTNLGACQADGFPSLHQQMPPAETAAQVGSKAQGEAAQVVQPQVQVVHVSPQSRLVALLLALAIPIAGLHRIYVGKIGTGILWLLTGGLLMVGQIVDLILILAGRFKDKEGRPVLRWGWQKGEQQMTVTDPQTAVQFVQARPTRRPSIFAGLLAFIGYSILIVGMLAGLAFALQLPWVVVELLGRDLPEIHGFASVPDGLEAIEFIGWSIVTVILTISVIVLVIARRRHGIWHMLRAVLGVGSMALSLCCIYYAIPVRQMVSISTIYAPNWQVLVHSIKTTLAIGSVAAFVAGATCLAWPADSQVHR